jgi:hypothetical protein
MRLYVANPGLTRPPPYEIVVEPSSVDPLPLIENALAQHHRWGAREAVEEYIQFVAGEIATFGEAWRELAIDDQDGEFRLWPILPGTLHATPFGTFQILLNDPPRSGHRFMRIPRQVLWRHVAPGISPQRWRKMISSMASLEAAGMPPWLPKALAEGNGLPSTEHRRGVDKALLDATVSIQCMPRPFMSESIVSPVFLAYRSLRFRAFCALLRNAIVTSINSALVAAGGRLGFHASVAVRGLPAPEEYEEAADSLRDGADHQVVLAELTVREKAQRR